MVKKFVLLCFVFLLLTACSVKTNNTHYFLKLSQSRFPIQLWKSDGSHFKNSYGTLTADSTPIVEATVQVGDKVVTTDQNGRFSYSIDQSQFSKKLISIKSLSNATIKGEKLDHQAKNSVSNLKAAIFIYFPVKIIKKVADGDKVILQAKAMTERNSNFPTIKADNQAIKGRVKDAQGNPVKHAIVSTTRSHGEGWAKSNPTDSNGEYMISLITEDDEDQTFRVTVNHTQYTLPEGRVFRFPKDSSLEIDAILPADGTLIADAPPTLVSKTIPGRMFRGTIIGLAGVAPSSYQATIPDENGNFRIVIFKKAPPTKLSFFEKQINQYNANDLSPGALVPESWLSPSIPGESVELPYFDNNQ